MNNQTYLTNMNRITFFFAILVSINSFIIDAQEEKIKTSKEAYSQLLNDKLLRKSDATEIKPLLVTIIGLIETRPDFKQDARNELITLVDFCLSRLNNQNYEQLNQAVDEILYKLFEIENEINVSKAARPDGMSIENGAVTACGCSDLSQIISLLRVIRSLIINLNLECDLTPIFTVLNSLSSGCSTSTINQNLVDAGGGEFVINQPGNFALSEDISAPGGGSGAIIFINSSDVTVDLCGKRITQIGDNSLSGIIVGRNFSNITIKNGAIDGMSLAGIQVNDGVFDLFLEQVTAVNCGAYGFFFNGTAPDGSPNPIFNSYLIECQAINCGIANPLGVNNTIVARFLEKIGNKRSRFILFSLGGLGLSECNNITVQNSKFCHNSSANVGGVFIASSNNCVFSDCLMNDNTGDTAVGCAIVSGSHNRFERCLTNANISSNAFGINGGFFMTACANTVITDCQSCNNQGSFADGFSSFSGTDNSFIDCVAIANINGLAGFHLNSESGTTMKNCQSLKNQGIVENTNMAGFLSERGKNNIFQNCIADAIIAEVFVAGFQFVGEEGSTVIDCLAKNINSTTKTAYGIWLQKDPSSGALCSSCYIKNNEIDRTVGPNNFGIQDEASPNSTTLVTGNFVFDSGTNYDVVYPSGALPLVSGSLSGGLPPTGTSGTFDNISINP